MTAGNRTPSIVWAFACLALLPVSARAQQGALGSEAPRSPQGQNRLLDWDLTKRFDPSLARFSGGDATAQRKSFGTAEFSQGKSFSGSKSFNSRSFSVSEFLPSSASAANRTFSESRANKASEQSFPAGGKAFETADNREAGRGFSTGKFPDKTPSIEARAYEGAEAQKMKQRYTPENAPAGGVSHGKVLTIDEVRDILNRSK